MLVISMRTCLSGLATLALAVCLVAMPNAADAAKKKGFLQASKKAKALFGQYVRDAKLLRGLIKKAKANKAKLKKNHLDLGKWTHVAVTHRKGSLSLKRKKQIKHKLALLQQRRKLRNAHKKLQAKARRVRRRLRRRRRRLRRLVKRHRRLQTSLKKWVKNTGKKDKTVPLNAVLEETESNSLAHDNPVFNAPSSASNNTISQ